MKKLLLLLILLPSLTFADDLSCSRDYWSYGKYEGITASGLATFTTQAGKTIIFSFNSCYVIKENK